MKQRCASMVTFNKAVYLNREPTEPIKSAKQP